MKVNNVSRSWNTLLAIGSALCLIASAQAQEVSVDAPQEVQESATGAGVESAPRIASSAGISDAVVLDDYQAHLGGDVFVDGGCAACGGCATGCGGCGACRSNCVYCDRIWVSAEYLLWWTRGMNVPALITTSPAGTARAQAGVLGVPGTEVLVGDEQFFTDVRNGARFRGGFWFDNSHCFGLEGEYFFLGDESERFREASDGSTIIARPFFNVLTGQEDSELVSFPGVVRGEALVDADTSLQSAGVRAVINLCCNQWCASGCVNGCQVSMPASQRWDLLVGYRYMDLNEGLLIREGLVSLLPTPDDGVFNIRDEFTTGNEFNGVDLGIRGSWTRQRWGLDLLAKCAFGSNRQYVRIDGSTITTVGGVTTPQVGGLLAQTTNIGEYSRNEFAAIPEFGATAYYQLSRRLRLSLGYSLVYWFDVVRPGDQIDRRVNPNLLPPPVLPLQGEEAPLFTFQEASMWLQGLSLGGELRW